MTKTKSTKRALLLSALSLLLCVSMFIGSTYAWFTDSVTSGSNVIQSGNLDIDVQYTLDGETWKDLAGATDLFQKGLWEPGHTEVVALKIENKGSLALKYVASMNIFNEVVGKNKDGGDIVLSDILTVSTLTQQVNQVGDISVMLAYMGENMVAYEETTSFKAGNILEADKELSAGEAHYVIIKVDMAETVGNEANHDGVNVPSIEFGLNVLATQYTYENDSFGNQYDKEATYDESWNTLADTSWYNDVDTEFTLTNVNQLAGLAKLVNTGVDTFAGKTVKLANDVDLGNKDWRSIGISGATFNGSFDGNGKTVSNLKVETNGMAGLFGYVAKGASFSNLKFNNVEITGNGEEVHRAGALFGYSNGAVTVENVSVTGLIQISIDGYYAGAVSGQSNGSKFINCSVIAEDGSCVEAGRWVGGICAYDNGATKITGCHVENLTVRAKSFVGGITGLGGKKSTIYGNTAKNMTVALVDAESALVESYGTIMGGLCVYNWDNSYLTAYDNAAENATCIVNGTAVEEQEMGMKYPEDNDYGLVREATIKVGDVYFTSLKAAFKYVPKDNTQIVVELTADTVVPSNFKPELAKTQNIIVKTNGYKLLWLKVDTSAGTYETDAEGNLITTEITAANLSTYVKNLSYGTLVIE